MRARHLSDMQLRAYATAGGCLHHGGRKVEEEEEEEEWGRSRPKERTVGKLRDSLAKGMAEKTLARSD